MPKVVVVGAGAAGMATARKLDQLGLDPVVVEARARLGGRTWSETLANGHVAERGGEYFHSGTTEVHELVAELGLHMTPQGFDPSDRMVTDPDGPSLAELEEGAKVVTEHWASLGDEISDDTSIFDVFSGAPVDPVIRAAIVARISSGMATHVRRVSARFSSNDWALVSHENNTRIAEGNQSLAERMADELGRHRVRTRWPVSAVRQVGNGYEVANVHGEVIAADAVVIAVPVSILDRIEIDLSEATRTAVDKIGFGQATKLHLIVEGDLEPTVKQDVATPFSTWATQGIGMDGASFVTGFGSTHETQDTFQFRDRGARLFRPALEAAWEGTKFSGDELFTYWGGDPWARGSYSFRPTGWTDVDEAALAAPHEGVFFAGEHTADLHRGSICGALRSGYRAAGEVAERLA
ncbi:flavin monoamine oxidase family protein [Aeromicrobium sp. JJY06]|uniref:flavin monoamine oxidase family protein n=1 Tax=Aeromicrobium sp. JJY06 TaxID=3373478 RepID=UPI00376F21B8